MSTSESDLICVQEEGSWSMKGHFHNAVKLVENLPWSCDEEGRWSVALQADVPSMASDFSSGTTSLLPSALLATSLSQREEMETLFGIPQSLTVCSKNVDLHLAYTKYQGVCNTQADLQRMMSDRTWTLGKVNDEEIIKLYVSKSVYYGQYMKFFPLAELYPPIVKWLENEEDSPPNIEVFGVDKSTYGFKDLRRLLEALEKSGALKKKRKLKVTGGESSSKRSKQDKSSEKEGSSKRSKRARSPFSENMGSSKRSKQARSEPSEGEDSM